jgi:hypothetical protein
MLDFHKKLEYLSLASLSILFYCLRVNLKELETQFPPSVLSGSESFLALEIGEFHS